MPDAPENAWKPDLDMSILDERVDNAMRRASGSIGLDISVDKGRMRALHDTAVNALEAGMSSPGPLFMRIGRGAFEAGFCKIGQSLDPKEVAAEILREFFTESTAAFQAAKAALASDALAFMQKNGMGEAHCRTVLAAADGAFSLPEKELFTREGLPFIRVIATPSTQAIIGGLAGFAIVFGLIRSPHLALFTAVLAGGGAYYLARRRVRRQCEKTLRLLPRNIYQMLATEWNANIRRYAETVNAGLARGNGASD
ncbi:MAG: inorganic phosphate transporter [Deltaproteobacteria bacterium]|nr:inorganic phosphate transporter [Deltaproteobacteria bacterium]